MCNPATQAQIESFVQLKLSAREMFTAYDITCAVRAQGISILHDDVRAIVHSMYCSNMMGVEYERTLVDVGGARGPAFVYHRYDTNAQDYTGNAQPHTIIQPVQTPPPAPTNTFDLTSIRQLIDRLGH